MAMPIVMLQAAARWVAQNFPGALTGYAAAIRESHQSTKKDTSGTAKALVADFQALGLPFTVEDIEKIRDPRDQLAMGVPREHLDGHAFHAYTVKSADGSVALSLSHNILGRRVYAEGTVWAIRFLSRRMESGEHGCSYNMQDVLRAMAELV
jgi:4-hydroxy-tetrahydrodipicolinate reductase